MFVLQNFLIAIAKVLNILLTLYMWIIIIRAVLSWFSPDPRNVLVQYLYRITEPVLYAIRRRIPLNLGGLDFSPIIVLLIIIFLQSFLVKSLLQFAYRMG